MTTQAGNPNEPQHILLDTSSILAGSGQDMTGSVEETGLEDQGAGQTEARSESQTESKATTPTVGAPVAKETQRPAMPPDAEQARQRMAEQQRYQQAMAQVQEQAQQLQREMNRQELVNYQRQLEQQGYGPEQVQQTVASYRDLQEQKLQLAQQRQAIAQHAQATEAELRAKWQVAMEISKQYDVPVDQLMAVNTPEAMEIIGLKANLAKTKTANTPTQAFDSNRPSPRAAPSRERRLEDLTKKVGPLTDAEHRELGRIMGLG